MTELAVLLFYLVLINALAGGTYYFSNPSMRMEYSLGGALVGVVIAYALWTQYGQYSVMHSQMGY
jgi:hypothetical protein